MGLGLEKMIRAVYAAEDDMTFILEEGSGYTKVVGFYFGSPSEEATEKYAGDMEARYDA